MNEHDFWSLIGTTDDGLADESALRLEDTLAQRSEGDIIDFADHLARSLYALDTPAHAAAARNPGSDAFLYLRCAVVASGHDAFRRAVQNPAALQEFRDAEAEPLLYVAERAYERSTGMPWEHETPVDYESGTNPAWGHVSSHDVATESTSGWLKVLGTYGTPDHNDTFANYSIARALLIETLNESPEWRRWWQESKVPNWRYHYPWTPTRKK